MKLDLDLITTETAANFAAVNYLHKAEFAKLPEGSKRSIKGKDYYLKDSRWHSAESGELLENKIEKAESAQDAIDEKASSEVNRKERRELMADLAKSKPYLLRPVNGGYEITISHQDLNLGNTIITQSPSTVMVTGDRVQIIPGKISGAENLPQPSESTHQMNSHPIKLVGNSQLQIHDFLHHPDRGVLKKPDGKFAQFQK